MEFRELSVSRATGAHRRWGTRSVVTLVSLDFFLPSLLWKHGHRWVRDDQFAVGSAAEWLHPVKIPRNIAHLGSTPTLHQWSKYQADVLHVSHSVCTRTTRQWHLGCIYPHDVFSSLAVTEVDKGRGTINTMPVYPTLSLSAPKPTSAQCLTARLGRPQRAVQNLAGQTPIASESSSGPQPRDGLHGLAPPVVIERSGAMLRWSSHV